MFDYYIVIKKVHFNNSEYPQFFNCSKTEKGFQVIQDLSRYLENGQGLSDEIISDYSSFTKFTSWNILASSIGKIKL